MKSLVRVSLVSLFAIVAAAPAFARLGEDLGDLKKRYGSPAPSGERKDQAYWLFEGDDGQLMYSVTFNAKGQSIAEGLKPIKQARFDRALAMDFIGTQRSILGDSKTTRVLKPGDVYQFSGKRYVCDAKEYVVVDEPRGLLIIWSQAGVPQILALSPEMMARMN